MTRIIKRAASKLGAEILLEPDYEYAGRITFRHGGSAFFRGTSLDINSYGAAVIARDKGYTSFFLESLGYSVPEWQTFFSDRMNLRLAIKRSVDDGYTYAKRIGFPVIIKPNDLSQGRLVAKVYNKREFHRLARLIVRETDVFKVERYHDGNDYRLVVLDNQVMLAYRRMALQVTGDGRSTVSELLASKQELLSRSGRRDIIDVNDLRVAMNLRRQKLGLDSILPAGVTMRLLDNANLSSGGDAVDVTRQVHEDFRLLAGSVASDMGLRFCGVDIITSDIIRPLKDYVIVEVNSAPGLENYASLGAEQGTAVEAIYLRILEVIEKTSAAL